MECFFGFFKIIRFSKLLLIRDIKQSLGCSKCSKSFVLSTVLPLGFLRGGFDDVRVWQDKFVLVGLSILDVLKIPEVVFTFKIFIKSFASFSKNDIDFRSPLAWL